MKCCLVLLLAAVSFLLISSSPVVASRVYFALMVSNRSGDLGTFNAVQSTINIALEDINTNILNRAATELVYSKPLITECNDLSLSEEMFLNALNSSFPPIAFIGTGCSLITQHLSHIANQYSIPMLSYAATTPVLDNLYPNGLVRLIPSDSYLPAAVVGILREYGWSQIAVVTQSSVQYNETFRLLNESLTEASIAVNAVNVFDTESHIFFLNCDPERALEILCQAYHRRIYYPNYMWITFGWYPVNWWNSSSTGCSQEQISTVLNRSFSIASVVSISSDHSVSSYARDAVYSLAIALNTTLSNGATISNLTGLTDNILNTEFTGATGFVQFTNTGERNISGDVLIQQYQQLPDGNIATFNIALFTNQSGFRYINNMTAATVFPGGIPPDGTPIKIFSTARGGVIAFVVILLSIAMIFTIACFFFNVIFRNRKIVKLTSPNLNYIIIIGAIFFLISLAIYPGPMRNELALKTICTLRRLLLSLGHDICFTVALVKTWRVHYIFRSPSPNKRVPKDSKLFLIIIAILSVDVFFTLALLIPDIFLADIMTTRDRELSTDRDERGVLRMYCLLRCGNTTFVLVWFALIVPLKLILHVVAIVLAFRIRNIEVDAVNDYKSTSAIVYTSTVLIVIVLVVTIGFTNYVNVFAVLSGILVSLEVLVFMGFTFVPKMIALYRDPKGKEVFSKSTMQRNHEGSEGVSTLKDTKLVTQVATDTHHQQQNGDRRRSSTMSDSCSATKTIKETVNADLINEAQVSQQLNSP